MTVLKKAVIRAYTSATHKAAVQVAGSLAVWLDSVAVATDIPAADVVAGRECSVLFFDDTNPVDATVIAINQGLLSAGGGATTTDIHEDGSLVKADADPLDFRGGFDVLAFGTGVQISLDIDESPLTGLAKLAGRAGNQVLAGNPLGGGVTNGLTLRASAIDTDGLLRLSSGGVDPHFELFGHTEILGNLTLSGLGAVDPHLMRDGNLAQRIAIQRASPHVQINALAADVLRVVGHLEMQSGPLRLAASPDNIIQDSGGATRLTARTTSPHLQTAGSTRLGTASTDLASVGGAINVYRLTLYGGASLQALTVRGVHSGGVQTSMEFIPSVSGVSGVSGLFDAFLAAPQLSNVTTLIDFTGIRLEPTPLHSTGALPNLIGMVLRPKLYHADPATIDRLFGLRIQSTGNNTGDISVDATALAIENLWGGGAGAINPTPLGLGLDIGDFSANFVTTIYMRQTGAGGSNRLQAPTILGAVSAAPEAGYALELRDDLLLGAFFAELREMTAPGAPATNGLRLYAEDNGAGKTRLMARFATGAAVQIAIEP